MNVSQQKHYQFNLHFFIFPALQGILCDALESFFHVDAFLGRSLKVWNVPFWGTPSPSLFLRYLHWWGSMLSSEQENIPSLKKLVVMVSYNHYGFTSPVAQPKKWKAQRIRTTYHSTISPININFVADHHKWKIFWIRWACLQFTWKTILLILLYSPNWELLHNKHWHFLSLQTGV